MDGVTSYIIVNSVFLAVSFLSTVALVFRAIKQHAWSSAVWYFVLFGVCSTIKQLIFIVQNVNVQRYYTEGHSNSLMETNIKLALFTYILTKLCILFVFLAPIIAARGISIKAKLNGFTAWLHILIVYLIIIALFGFAWAMVYAMRIRNSNVGLFDAVSTTIDYSSHFLIAFSFVVVLAIHRNFLFITSLHFNILQWTGSLLVFYSGWGILDYFLLDSGVIALSILGYIFLFLPGIVTLWIAIAFVKAYKAMLSQDTV